MRAVAAPTFKAALSSGFMCVILNTFGGIKSSLNGYVECTKPIE
jgi:hypothetical protein